MDSENLTAKDQPKGEWRAKWVRSPGYTEKNKGPWVGRWCGSREKISDGETKTLIISEEIITGQKGHIVQR